MGEAVKERQIAEDYELLKTIPTPLSYLVDGECAKVAAEIEELLSDGERWQCPLQLAGGQRRREFRWADGCIRVRPP